MTLDVSGINWLAVVVAAFVYFALGAVWFAPQTPIGRAWMQAADYKSPTTGASASSLFYIVPAATCLVMVVATALLARATGTDTLGEGMVLGLVLGVGLAVPLMLTTAAFEFTKPRRFTWGIIDASYHLVGLLIAAIILALWR